MTAIGTTNGKKENGTTTGNSSAAMRRSVLVLYGTETGNSQDLAECVARRLRRVYFSPTLDEMDGVQLVSRKACRCLQLSAVLTWKERKTDHPSSILVCYFCYIHHRPRRHATQLPKVLEEVAAKEIIFHQSYPSSFRCLWAW